jgi:hypothetical protein
MPREQSKQPLMILIVFGIVMAFLGYEMMQFRRAGKKVHGVEVAVRPAELKLKPGESAVLKAAMVGSENPDLVWKVTEPNGGSVSSMKVSEAKYTAPATAGTFHVVVTSKADETKSATATVSVAQ